MADHNEVAFHLPNVRTIKVTHAATNKLYTYLSFLPNMRIGDSVIVRNKLGLALATVQQVDETLRVQRGDPMKYGWVLAHIPDRALKTTENVILHMEQKLRDAQRVTEGKTAPDWPDADVPY